MSFEWTLRSIRNTQKDRKSLATFACADLSIPWQAEVEGFVQTLLFDWRYAPLARANDPPVLLMFHTSTKALIGVAAHERVVLQAGSDSFHATKLEVMALNNNWQARHSQVESVQATC